MPTYDYKCSACGHQFELFHSMKDAPKKKCPKCAKNALERLIGAGGGLLFKGGGFYETDYRSDSYKKAAAADKPVTPASGGSCGCGKKSASECASSKPAKAPAASE
jgi:putative FmdB family regulatory protein